MLLLGINEIYAQFGAPAVAIIAGLIGTGGISTIIVLVVKKILKSFATSNSSKGIADNVFTKLSANITEKGVKIAIEPIVAAAMAKMTASQDAKTDKLTALVYELIAKIDRTNKAISYSKLIPETEKQALLNGESVIDDKSEEIQITSLQIEPEVIEEANPEKTSKFA